MDGGSGGDYFFSVMPYTVQPFGPVTKENLDVTLLVFDFTCWLNAGETIGAIAQPAVQLEGAVPVPPWQNDYPLDNTSVTQPPADTYPLMIQSAAITLSASQVQVRVSAGTPGLNYVVSVIATSSEAQPRRKQVDCLVTIEKPLNLNMVAAATPDPSAGGQPIIVNGSTTIPMGYNGRVYVQNTSGAPIIVTLPITPTQLQRVAPVDITGNAGAFPITYQGAPGNTIYAASSFVSDINYDDLIFEWTGAHWIVLASRYAFLG
jgi:hypothetical protein